MVIKILKMSCPRCQRTLDESNRLVTDYCGHFKCRGCLILEESHCLECSRSGENSLPNTYRTEMVAENEVLGLENIPVAQCTSNREIENTNKKKRKRSQIPSYIETEKTTNGKVIYFCRICNKRFNSRTQRYYHMYCNSEQNKPYSCNKCSKTFSSLSHFKYHMEGHQEICFPCNVCGKTFSRLAILRKHAKIHCQEKYTCHDCGLQFKDKTAFAGHKAKHKSMFKFNCEICAKTFSLRSNLYQHKAMHTGKKEFKCSKCGKEFQRNYTLKLHALRHTKDKFDSCSICHKNFTDSNSFIRHRNIHEGRIKYKCNQCNIVIMRKDNMIRHVRNMHPGVKFLDCVEVVENNVELRNKNNIGMQTEENTPLVIANSSVIRCVGNVEPVVIPPQNDIESFQKNEGIPDSSNTPQDKKIKKKYDPFKIYRKILCTDDEPLTDEEDSDNVPKEATTSIAVDIRDQNLFYSSNSNLLNFSEMHWRKNLNLRVKENWQ